MSDLNKCYLHLSVNNKDADLQCIQYCLTPAPDHWDKNNCCEVSAQSHCLKFCASGLSVFAFFCVVTLLSEVGRHQCLSFSNMMKVMMILVRIHVRCILNLQCVISVQLNGIAK